MLLSVALVVVPEAEAVALAKTLVDEGLVARAEVLPAADRNGGAAALVVGYATVLTENRVLFRCAQLSTVEPPAALLVRIDDADPLFRRWVEHHSDDAPLIVD